MLIEGSKYCSMLGANGHRAARVLYGATPTVTEWFSVRFKVLSQRPATLKARQLSFVCVHDLGLSWIRTRYPPYARRLP